MTVWPGLSLTARLEHDGALVASEMIDGHQAWQPQRWDRPPASDRRQRTHGRCRDPAGRAKVRPWLFDRYWGHARLVGNLQSSCRSERQTGRRATCSASATLPTRSWRRGMSAIASTDPQDALLPCEKRDRPARLTGAIQLPRKGASAQTDADDRFDDLRHPTGRLPPTDRARREPASHRSGTGAVSGARFSRRGVVRLFGLPGGD